MNSKLLIATIVGAIAAFLGGWVVFGMLLMGFYESNITVYEGLLVNPPRLGAIFIANLAWAFTLAYVFDKWSNTRSFMPGFMNGLLLGLLFTISFDMFIHATMNLYTPTLIAVDIVVNALFSGVIGGVIAAILGSGKPAGA